MDNPSSPPLEETILRSLLPLQPGPGGLPPPLCNIDPYNKDVLSSIIRLLTSAKNSNAAYGDLIHKYAPLGLTPGNNFLREWLGPNEPKANSEHNTPLKFRGDPYYHIIGAIGKRLWVPRRAKRGPPSGEKKRCLVVKDTEAVGVRCMWLQDLDTGCPVPKATGLIVFCSVYQTTPKPDNKIPGTAQFILDKHLPSPAAAGVTPSHLGKRTAEASLPSPQHVAVPRLKLLHNILTLYS
eukprot:TRINITY_DN28742_c0_g1_i1.p1 TRINITY_DN28742_c0_g1~~TRINITY_DN28742_c0_g1_i1.p1  ORF type:complete len:245 (+),score=23.85 TRINITY_DN28742_c0_g1_i1:24-737(+)